MYQAFYRLQGKPFQLTPDSAMLFPSKGHKRAMSYLLYGLEQGEGFVMITGAVGTGKTLLIQRLFKELSQRNIATASVASANLDGEDILPAVASAFDLPYEGRSKEALLQDLKTHLATLRDRRSHALLVVDEAQTLTPAALEMLRILSNLEIQGHALLQVFLIGQAELRRTILNNRMEQLRQRIIASHELVSLGAEESREYILHRLRSVGWDHYPELETGVFTEVFLASRGIPRRINLIMDRLLLHGYLEELSCLDRATVTVVLDEMREEMADLPATLEVPSGPPKREPAAVPPTSEREAELMVLDRTQRNNILLQLMHENIQLREKLAKSPPVPAADHAVAANMRHGRSRRKRK